MLGLNLHTAHTAHMPCDDTAGVYYRGSDFGAGVFKNSECRVGAWGGWTRETNTLTLGPVSAKAGVVAGLVLGYAENPVLPLLLPSVAVSWGGKTWLRFTYLPKVKASAGVSVSLEFDL